MIRICLVLAWEEIGGVREPWLTAAAGKEGSPVYRENYQMAESHEHRSLDEGRGKHLSFFLNYYDD